MFLLDFETLDDGIEFGMSIKLEEILTHLWPRPIFAFFSQASLCFSLLASLGPSMTSSRGEGRSIFERKFMLHSDNIGHKGAGGVQNLGKNW